MAGVLHLVKSPDVGLARAAIEQQLRAGDRVSVALLHGAPAPDVPAGVPLFRVPEEVPYDRLLELIFEADQVVAW
ncbi:MAG TPA: hypothetical protein VNO23_16665 [Candidatus Binatia bacterium]|nr:hypothetical protein [Candidatus Binatia bacterium]